MTKTKELFLLVICMMLVACSLLMLSSCNNEIEEHVCNFGEWQAVEGEEATCTDSGKEIRVCKDDASHTEERTVDALGHTLEGDYIQSPGGHWQLCSVCGEREEVLAHESAGPATSENAEVCKICGYEISPKLHMLDGKRIIIIGDSFVFYGNMVIEKAVDNLNQTSRSNDKGLFYQICRANGADVEVTNWTYGGHGIANLLSESCTVSGYDCEGMDHINNLKDRNYDYVIFSCGRGQNGRDNLYYFDVVNEWMNIFKEANPNVKFVQLVSSGSHNVSTDAKPTLPHNILNNLDTISEMGVTVVDWGKLVKDVIDGTVAVPGATQSYNKNSFIVARTTADGYHPNQLAGYITALMTYCAITGESAVGQDYSFCGNKSVQTKFDFETFINQKYKNGETTNYPEIFASKEDMRGLQTLIDQYLEEKAYMNYDYAPLTQ